ncbi:hypothetical protein F4V91_26140 [Neorhizobium galegae]|uniref:Uncharacterized protein n=1 Tax=Neorhizobium galegae TaxID=399 RepID=A0A6A1TGG8_NEOGA|nr:hypothetical protein F4V91_26140 [Neorhizobium galegae]
MIGAGRLAKLPCLKRCIGFDTGGTTAKSTLSADRAPAIEIGYVIGEEATASHGVASCQHRTLFRRHRCGSTLEER